MANDIQQMGAEHGVVLHDADTGSVSAAAREQYEMQAQFIVARSAPRNEVDAFTRVMKSCDRPSFAEKASYGFPRGGTTVRGPSVNLAREMARAWGNLRYGVKVVQMDAKHVHVKGWALDCETNTYVEGEAKFGRQIQRKDKRSGETRWVDADERDLRELVNKHGAIAVRNAILQLLPPDLTESATLRARETLEKAARGEIKQNREEVIRRLATAFAQVGVTLKMIEAKLGHEINTIEPNELADLRCIFTSLSDGSATIGDHFEREQAPSSQPKSRAETLKGRIGKAPVVEVPTVEAGADVGPEPSPDSAEDAHATALFNGADEPEEVGVMTPQKVAKTRSRHENS